MSQLGADADQLEALGRRFGAGATLLDGAAVSISTSISTVVWMGPDADAFRGRWRSTMAPQLRTIAEALRGQRDTAAEQARQQRTASAAEGGAIPSGIIDCLPLPPDWENPLEPRYEPPVEPRFDPPIDLSPELPPDRVVRTEILRGSGSIGIGPGQGQVGGTWLVEHLANGRTRVTLLQSLQVGAGADAGARGDLDLGSTEFKAGAMAGAELGRGFQGRQTWEVPTDQVDELITGVYLDHADPTGQWRRAGGAVGDLVDGVIPDQLGPVDLPFDEAHDVARRYLDYDVPPPTRQGLDITTSAEAYALVGANGQASADARAELGIEVGGFRESDGDLGLRYAVSGSAAGGVDAPIHTLAGMFAPHGVEGAANASIAVVTDGPGGLPKQLVYEQVSGTGDNQTLQRVTVDVNSPAVAEDVQTIKEWLSDPSSENRARVQQVNPREWGDVRAVQSDLAVSGEDYGAGAGAGAIPGIVEGSVDVRFERQTIVHDYGEGR